MNQDARDRRNDCDGIRGESDSPMRSGLTTHYVNDRASDSLNLQRLLASKSSRLTQAEPYGPPPRGLRGNKRCRSRVETLKVWE